MKDGHNPTRGSYHEGFNRDKKVIHSKIIILLFTGALILSPSVCNNELYSQERTGDISEKASNISIEKLRHAKNNPASPRRLNEDHDVKIEARGSYREVLLSPYSIQLGSYRTLERAKKAITHYSKRGLSPYWVKVNLKEKGIWYRVFTGYFEDKQKADIFRQEYGLTESVIKKTPYANLIGTYQSRGELEAQVQLLRNLDYSPIVIANPDGTSRLFVGAFSTKAEAEELYIELKSDHIKSQVIERHVYMTSSSRPLQKETIEPLDQDGQKVGFINFQRLLNQSKIGKAARVEINELRDTGASKEAINNREKELVSAILKNARKALADVARKLKYTIIIKDPNIIAYLDPGSDITDLVIKELDKSKTHLNKL